MSLPCSHASPSSVPLVLLLDLFALVVASYLTDDGRRFEFNQHWRRQGTSGLPGEGTTEDAVSRTGQLFYCKCEPDLL